jgi:hypothetical protein
VFNDSTSAEDISFFRLGDFKSSTYDANYRIDGLGDVAPVSAFLFVSPTPGFINFDFSDTSNPDGLAPGQSSFFMFLDTDATSYSRNAFADVASSGTFFASNEIATFSPGRSRAAPAALELSSAKSWDSTTGERSPPGRLLHDDEARSLEVLDRALGDFFAVLLSPASVR